MPQLTTINPVLNPSPLSSSTLFSGLIVISSGLGMPGACCGFDSTLILKMSAGNLVGGFSYEPGQSTASLYVDPIVSIPATDESFYYLLGYMSGNPDDLIANLPITHLSFVSEYELTVPDVATLDLGDLMAFSLPLGTTPALLNDLESQVVTLEGDLTTSQSLLSTTQLELQTAQDLNTSLADEIGLLEQELSELTTELQELSTNLTEQSQVKAIREKIRAIRLAASDCPTFSNQPSTMDGFQLLNSEISSDIENNVIDITGRLSRRSTIIPKLRSVSSVCQEPIPINSVERSLPEKVEATKSSPSCSDLGSEPETPDLKTQIAELRMKAQPSYPNRSVCVSSEGVEFPCEIRD